MPQQLELQVGDFIVRRRAGQPIKMWEVAAVTPEAVEFYAVPRSADKGKEEIFKTPFEFLLAVGGLEFMRSV